MCSTRMFIARRSAKQRTEMYVTVFHLVRQKWKTRHYNVQLVAVVSFRITVQILPTDATDLRNAYTAGAVIATVVQRPVHGLDIRDIALQFPAGTRGFPLLQSVQTFSEAHPASCSNDAGGSSSKVKRLGREADRSPPSSAGVKNEWSCNPLPYTPSWQVLGQFYFVFMQEIL